MQSPLAKRMPLLLQRQLLGKYFVPQRGRIVLLAALVLGDIALRLVNPQIIRSFIDTAEAGGPASALTIAAVLFLVTGLAGRAINLGSTYAGLNLGWAATNRLRADLTRHLLRLDMPFHKMHTPGELIERVDGDVTTLRGILRGDGGEGRRQRVCSSSPSCSCSTARTRRQALS